MIERWSIETIAGIIMCTIAAVAFIMTITISIVVLLQTIKQNKSK